MRRLNCKLAAIMALSMIVKTDANYVAAVAFGSLFNTFGNSFAKYAINIYAAEAAAAT